LKFLEFLEQIIELVSDDIDIDTSMLSE